MEENNNIVEYTAASLRALAATFPIVSSVAAGWSEYKNIKQSEHIKEILGEFAKRITLIENSLLNEEFLRSDEMKRLIEQVASKGKDEIINEKRHYYSEFLKNATTLELSHDDEKEMVLETISKLSVSHIKILIEAEDMINTARNSMTKENKSPWQYFHIDGDEVPMGNTKNNTAANIDYMLAVGVIETPILRGSILSYDTRAVTLSFLGWRVIDYLK
jgi:hypothetical protein